MRDATWTDAKPRERWIVSPIVVAGIAVILLAAGVIGAYWAVGGSRVVAEVPVAEPGSDLKAVPSMSQELVEIDRTVRGYLGAASVREKLRYVRHPLETGPRMARHYARNTPKFAEVFDYPVIAKRRITPRFEFYVLEALCMDASRHCFSLVEEDGGFLIDWESSLGYNPMSWNDYLEQKPDTPLDFRIRATPTDYFGGDFPDDGTWRCLRLTYPGTEALGYAYYRSGHPDAALLARLMAAGPESPMILTMRFSDPPPVENHMEMVKVVNDSWLVP